MIISMNNPTHQDSLKGKAVTSAVAMSILDTDMEKDERYAVFHPNMIKLRTLPT